MGRYVSPKLIAAYSDKPIKNVFALNWTRRYIQWKSTGKRFTTERRIELWKCWHGAGYDGGASNNLFAGYDWYNNDVERGQPPRHVQSSQKSDGALTDGLAEDHATTSAPTEVETQPGQQTTPQTGKTVYTESGHRYGHAPGAPSDCRGGKTVAASQKAVYELRFEEAEEAKSGLRKSTGFQAYL